jgi:hypothetical protein
MTHIESFTSDKIRFVKGEMEMQSFVNRPPVLLGYPCKFPAMSLPLLLEEPCLFSCSEDEVMKEGGVLAKMALQHIIVCYYDDIHRAKEEGLSSVVDVRVHRLMPDMFPAIPGWHCDAVPRNNIHGQPNFEAINPHAFHVCVTLSNEPTGVSNTEYVMDAIKPNLWDDAHVYRDLHEQVEKISPRTRCIKDGQFVKFWPKSIHRATATHRRGVRMFMRFSMYHKPPLLNKVHAPQQVYQLSESNGW